MKTSIILLVFLIPLTIGLWLVNDLTLIFLFVVWLAVFLTWVIVRTTERKETKTETSQK